MKTFIKILVLTSFILTSCSKENEESYSYKFLENKKLNIEYYYEESYLKYGNIEDGTNLVFEYKFSAEDEVDISDDEYSEYIRFEINKELNDFSFVDEELVDSKIVFTKSCFCNFDYNPDKDVLPTGTISGEKISDTKWNISIDVTFYGDESKNIISTFRLNN